MTLGHEIFDVFNAVVEIVALIVVFREGKGSRRLIVTAVVLLLVGLGGLVAFEWNEHRQSVRSVRGQIIDQLQSGPKTLDELGIILSDVNLPLLREALESAVHDREVSGEPQKLSQRDGSLEHTVRLYFLPSRR